MLVLGIEFTELFRTGKNVVPESWISIPSRGTYQNVCSKAKIRD